MPKGGARARSGPAPDPDALRRDRDAGEWTVLPAEGRDGDPPAFPLIDPSGREVELWRGEWLRPQALAWERLGLEHEVALYVRNLALAEQPGAPVTLSTLVKQLRDSLGLSVAGLRANRWRIARDEVAEKREGTGRPAASRSSSARARLEVIDGGA
ncbi:hypothetical protein [Micromonospora sp. NPDC047730]|uniref:hypothetical protein n=1 Tax=Micromonospora sp. NPDC047730 TaxID=3364253 RepID=UPI0037205B59